MTWRGAKEKMASPGCESERSKKSFQDLPLEIRRQIYGEMLRGGNQWRLGEAFYNMTATCQQIRGEIFEHMLRQRVFYMENIKPFLQWVKRGRGEHLELVRHMSFRFETKKFWGKFEAEEEGWPGRCRQLLESEGVREGVSESEGGECSREGTFRKVLNAFLRIRNCEVVHVDFHLVWPGPDLEGAQRVQDEEQLMLEAMSIAWPRMRSFTVVADVVDFGYIGRFRELRHLCFSGYSKTSPGEALRVLLGLKWLESFWIRQDDHKGGFARGSSSQEEYLSVTAEVVRQMNPLRVFRVSNTSDWRSGFFGVGLWRSLYEGHSRSLKEVVLDADRHRTPVLTKELLMEILRLVVRLRIQDFRLEFKIGEELLKEFGTIEAFRRLFGDVGEAVDVFMYSSVIIRPVVFVEIRGGKYFPSAKKMADRRSVFKEVAGFGPEFVGDEYDMEDKMRQVRNSPGGPAWQWR